MANAMCQFRWDAVRHPTVVAVAFIGLALLASSGCEKVPTFKELTGQESAPATPVAAPAAPEKPAPSAAPAQAPVVSTPAQIENPQQVISSFQNKSTYERGDADVARLAGLSAGLDSITEMDFTSAKGLTDAGAQHLEKFPNIERLSLAGTKVTEVGVSALTALPKLTSLDLRGCVLSREMLNAVGKIERLEQLNLSQSNVGEISIEGVRNLAELRELNLSHTAISDEALKILADCPKLEVLLLQRTPINGSGMQFLRPKKGPAPPLRVLDVSSTRFGEHGMPFLKGMETLEEFIANECGITDQLLLQHLKGVPRLRKISLGFNSISDVGTQALGGIKSLEEISLHACNTVGDRTLGYLKAHKKLRTLDLKGCRISAGALQAFHKLLPDCEVLSN